MGQEKKNELKLDVWDEKKEGPIETAKVLEASLEQQEKIWQCSYIIGAYIWAYKLQTPCHRAVWKIV